MCARVAHLGSGSQLRSLEVHTASALSDWKSCSVSLYLPLVPYGCADPDSAVRGRSKAVAAQVEEPLEYPAGIGSREMREGGDGGLCRLRSPGREGLGPHAGTR